MKEHIAAVFDWLRGNAQNILFTFGFAAIAVGFAILDLSLGLIIPGFMVCGLLIWGRIGRGGGDHA
jgi:hypothetical protein